MRRGAQGSLAYYKKAPAEHTRTACLVFDGNERIGSGGVSYYTLMPTCHNPGDKKACIMNMYTRGDHRRKGIALTTPVLPVQDAKSRGRQVISPEATAPGRPLYEK